MHRRWLVEKGGEARNTFSFERSGFPQRRWSSLHAQRIFLAGSLLPKRCRGFNQGSRTSRPWGQRPRTAERRNHASRESLPAPRKRRSRPRKDAAPNRRRSPAGATSRPRKSAPGVLARCLSENRPKTLASREWSRSSAIGQTPCLSTRHRKFGRRQLRAEREGTLGSARPRFARSPT